MIVYKIYIYINSSTINFLSKLKYISLNNIFFNKQLYNILLNILLVFKKNN